jgi:hypothetical protein
LEEGHGGLKGLEGALLSLGGGNGWFRHGSNFSSFQPNEVSMYGQRLCNSDQRRDRGPSIIWKGEGGYTRAVLLVEFQVRTPKTK